MKRVRPGLSGKDQYIWKGEGKHPGGTEARAGCEISGGREASKMGAKLLPEWRAASAKSPEGRSGLALDANSLCWNSEGKGG